MRFLRHWGGGTGHKPCGQRYYYYYYYYYYCSMPYPQGICSLILSWEKPGVFTRNIRYKEQLLCWSYNIRGENSSHFTSPES